MRETFAESKISNLGWLVFGVLVLATVLSFLALSAHADSDGLLKVFFLDVGQGDAELVDFNGSQILIDGGPDDKVVQELGKIMPFYDHSIDLILLTHPHADHVAGLIEVLKRYKVDKIIENYTPYNTAQYAEWNNEKNSAEVVQAQIGQTVSFGDGGPILSILFPFNSVLDDASSLKNPHDAMVVSRLDYKNQGILFMGDAEAKTEHQIIQKGENIGAQFIKIGHHGSKTSSSEELLRAVNPELAFIEVGKNNKYGLPSQQVLDRLRNYDIKYYRTDVDGTVELVLDGQNYRVNHKK